MASLAVTKAIRALERSGGVLLPVDVVEAARNPSSPLHEYFTWNDSEAAERYRLSEARALIRSVRIEVTIHDVPVSVVGYVRDPDLAGSQSGYRNIIVIRSQEDSARAVLIDEMARVASAVRRARALAVVLGVEEDLDAIDALARTVSERIIGSDLVAGNSDNPSQS